MAVFSIPRVNLEAELNLILGGPLGTCHVHLFTNAITPNPGSTTADFTEPTWTGYAAATSPGWSAAAADGDIAFTDSDVLNFTVGGDPGSQLVRGYYVTDNIDTALLFAESFTTPITPLEGFDVSLQIRRRHRNP